MPAGTYDKFIIEQGSTFSHTLTWKDSAGVAIDLTGYTARMTIREDTVDETEIISLTTENSRITLGGVAGTIALTITAADTDALEFTDALYDLELVSGSTVTRLIQGRVRFSKAVTT